jgi:hypothetical protein
MHILARVTFLVSLLCGAGLSTISAWLCYNEKPNWFWFFGIGVVLMLISVLFASMEYVDEEVKNERS